MSQGRAVALLFCISLGLQLTSASASPFEEFFRKVGNAFAHPRHAPAPSKSARSRSSRRPAPSPRPSASPEQQVAATKGGQAGAQASTETPTPLPERRATSMTNPQPTRADLPYGVPVPGRAGFVFSPYSPNGGYVDVRGYASGTAVKDPYTGKIFLTP